MKYYKVKKLIEECLKKIQIDYIDIVLIHQPEDEKSKIRINIWKALEESGRRKKIKNDRCF